MNDLPSATGSSFRDVTPEEIVHYRQLGWVKLKKFVPVAEVDKLLAMGKRLMGEDGARNPPPKTFSYFNPLTMRGLALQLHFTFEVSTPCRGLVSAPPKRPCDDGRRLDTPLCELAGNAADLLDRPADQERLIVARRGFVFLGGTALAW